MGFEVLGVVYGWWGAGRAGQIMLSEAKWLSHTPLPPFFYGARCALSVSDAKGQGVALADAHAGMMGAGLLRGTQPSGTHDGWD